MSSELVQLKWPAALMQQLSGSFWHLPRHSAAAEKSFIFDGLSSIGLLVAHFFLLVVKLYLVMYLARIFCFLGWDPASLLDTGRRSSNRWGKHLPSGSKFVDPTHLSRVAACCLWTQCQCRWRKEAALYCALSCADHLEAREQRVWLLPAVPAMVWCSSRQASSQDVRDSRTLYLHNR